MNNQHLVVAPELVVKARRAKGESVQGISKLYSIGAQIRKLVLKAQRAKGQSVQGINRRYSVGAPKLV